MPGLARALLPFDRRPGFCRVALRIKFLGQQRGRAQLNEAAEDVAHQDGFLGVDDQFFVGMIDVVAQREPAAKPFSFAFRPGDFIAYPFDADRPFEFRKT